MTTTGSDGVAVFDPVAQAQIYVVDIGIPEAKDANEKTIK